MVDTFFNGFRRVLSPFSLSSKRDEDKNRGWQTREKERKRENFVSDRRVLAGAEGAILPAKTNPSAYNRENYPGHTLHYRGNIELDVTGGLRYVLVRNFIPASLLCYSRFYTIFFFFLIIRKAIAPCPNGKLFRPG